MENESENEALKSLRKVKCISIQRKKKKKTVKSSKFSSINETFSHNTAYVVMKMAIGHIIQPK